MVRKSYQARKMNTKLTAILFFLTACVLFGNTEKNSFASLLGQEDGTYRYEAFNVIFDVLEVENGALRMLDEHKDNQPIYNAINRDLTWRKGFNALYIQGPAAALVGISSDTVDTRAFLHCPVLPTKVNASQMHLRTRSDFIQQLGKPSWVFDDFCFKGFFSIKNEKAEFCWFLFHLKSKRLFVGFSQPNNAN